MPRSLSYPLPANAEEFERLCLRLFRRHWELPQIERFSPNGAGPNGAPPSEDHSSLRDRPREHPIDLLEVSGRRLLSAVQCEYRPGSATLTEAEIRDLVERASASRVPVGRLVIATTARRTPRLDRSVFEVNRSLKANSPISVEVMTWSDVGDLLDEYPEVLTEFDGGASGYSLASISPYTRLSPRGDLAERSAGDSIDSEIDQARDCLEKHKFQMARLSLLRLREGRWEELSAAQKVRVLTNLGIAWLAQGEVRKAAMLFVAARSLAPDDENACANDALAHELLGERPRAYALAFQLRGRFPASARSLALWINNAPLTIACGELAAEIPPDLEGDPEVARVMARRALAQHDAVRAERFGRAVLNAGQGDLDAHLMLAQAILLGELGDGPSVNGDSESRLREAEDLLTRALETARAEHDSGAEAQTLMARAQARLALRNNEGAEQDIETAYARERKNPDGLCQYGLLLRSKGRINEAVEAFRAAAAIGVSAETEYHLAAALHERNNPGDLAQGADLLSAMLKRPETPALPFFTEAVACLVDTLCRLERWHEAAALLDVTAADRIAPMAAHTMRAQVSSSQGDWEQATRHLDAALGALDASSPIGDRRMLATLLSAMGRYADALELWQDLTADGITALDTRRLLDCATRLGRDDVMLDVLRKLREEGSTDPQLVRFELEILERQDPETALQVMGNYLDGHPEDRMMRLRRSALALRIGRQDLAEADVGRLPPVSETAPALGRAAVELMRGSGRPDDALRYGYDLLRRNFASPEAHRAFLAALAPIGAMPQVPDFEVAEPGAAVCYVDESGADKWVILDDTNDPDESLDEVGTLHPLTKTLRGKRVGAKFTLPEANRFSRPAGVIKQIISKYAYRYEDVLAKWETRFPAVPDIELVNTAPDPRESGELRLEAVAAHNGHGDARAMERLYASSPMPAHIAAERAEMSDMQAWLTLAGGNEGQIRCCLGSAEETAEAMAAFSRSDAVVLDSTAIATLFLLGRINHLPSWPKQFVISQSTLAELRRMAQDDSLAHLPPAVLAALGNHKGNGGQLRNLAATLESICRVRDGAALSAVAQPRRDKLIGLFGRHGAESVALAAMPGHALWSDDRILAGIAKSEFGVRRIWTQAALSWRVQVGTLDNKDYVAASTELIGWNYGFMAPSVHTWMQAGTLAKWNRDARPLKQALDQFASSTISLADALRMAAQLMVTIYDDNDLRGVRRGIMYRILDRLGQRPGALEAIEEIPHALPVRYGLDLIRAREAADVVRGWFAQHSQPAAH